jgi:dihydrolipoamide dehydrogenase
MREVRSRARRRAGGRSVSERFDAVVIGAGPAGEVAVSGLARSGLRVALVERELIGGECGYWACMPSKTLLRPPEVRSVSSRVAGVSMPGLDWPRIAAYRDWMIRNLDDSKQVAGYEERGITVVKGPGALAGPGRVEVNGRVLETQRVILATGSEPVIPPIEGLAEAGYWTNREATTFSEVPRSAILIGAGPVGIELGQMFARYGSEVTLVDIFDRVIPREDPQVSALIGEALEGDGVTLLVGRKAVAVRREGGKRIVRFEDGDEIEAEALVVASGRRARLEGLGLETVGLEPHPAGIAVDERCRAGEGIWAVGDVTGVALFTHVGTYQARIAVKDILGGSAKADYRAVPRVVFSDPEIAAVGLTEEQAREQRIDAATTTVDLVQAIARPYIYEENPRGTLGIVADRSRDMLVGAWAVAPLAAEWIHLAVLAIRAEIPLGVLADTIVQFPTFTEAYSSAIRALER